MAKEKKKTWNWNNKLYIKIYEAAKDGYTDKQIAATCGMSYSMFCYHKKRKGTIRWALKRARTKVKTGVDNVLEHVYGRLSDEHKALYDEICVLGKKNVKNGYEKVRLLMENQGENVQKQLFLYALVKCNFIQSKARKKCCVSLKKVQEWMTDPAFVAFLDEIQEGADDFYHDHFNKAVQNGETQAIIHAMKTKLRHRGFGEVSKLEVEGNVNVTGKLELDVSALSLSAQREIAQQLESQEKEAERLEEVRISSGARLQIPHSKDKK